MGAPTKTRQDARRLPTYGKDKDLARDHRPEVRQKLAERQDVAPEILYYLAEDDDPAVRRAIATNPSTPCQADLLLTSDPDEDVRLDLAHKIGRLVPELSRSEQTKLQTATMDALRALAIDSLPRVRQAIAEEIKATDSVPPDVVARLARDVEAFVAEPVLEFSPLLSDEDLLEIIGSEPVQGVLGAISRRRGLAAPLCDAIVDTDNAPAIAELLSNESAQIREETLDDLIDRAPGQELWHAPLATRPRLSEGAVNRICQFVSRSLLNSLQESSDLPPEFADAVAARIGGADDDAAQAEPVPDAYADREDADEEEDDELDERTPEQIKQEVLAYHEVGRLDDDVFRERIDRNDRRFVFYAFACLTELDVAKVRHILNAHSAIAAVALCRRAGLSMRTAIDVQSKITKIANDALIYAKNGVDYPQSDAELEQRLKMFLD